MSLRGRLSDLLHDLTNSKPKRLQNKIRMSFDLPGIEPQDPPEHHFCVAALARNEGRWIREWIEFHRLQGVEKFLIYDNMSTDDMRAVLAPYEEEGLVEVIPWPGFIKDFNRQTMAFGHAISYLGPRTRWIGFFDIDEYLFPTTEERVADVLHDYADVPALIVYWLMFGTSGIETPIEGLLTEEFVMRAPVPPGPVKDRVLANHKTIVQPSRVLGARGAHNFVTDVDGLNGWDDQKRPIRFKKPRTVTVDRLRLNHYYTKSKAEWKARYGRPGGSGGVATASYMDWKLKKVETGAVEDRTVQRYLPALKAALAERNG